MKHFRRSCRRPQERRWIGWVRWLAIGAVVLVVMLGARPVALSANPGSESFRSGTLEITVAPGDTLWNIAKRLSPSRDPRYVVYQIRKENALSSADIFPGQVLRFPAELAEE